MSVTVLIVDDEETARRIYSEFLENKGYEVLGVATLNEARECVQLGKADIILLDVLLPDGDGLQLLEETSMMPSRPPVIVITAHGDIDMAVHAMKNGAHDFLQKPLQLAQLGKSIQRAQEIVEMRRELDHLRGTQRKKFDFIIGKNPVIQQQLEHARRAAEASVCVLITGETGVGKEVMANAIHQMGPRADKLIVPINSASIQSTVFESELFGYEAGAFTGADKRKHGLMETADGGILFLDEISSMPLDIQAKLLRAVEEHGFRRVGGTNMIHVDVQILAASKGNLPAMVERGEFREDLYYRLKVVTFTIPPLRERLDDIPELVGFFIRQNNLSMGRNITDITPRAMQALKAHNWPGNIRELKNVIERATLFCDDATIDLAHLPADILKDNDE
jgi:DNA-binding NtrC family response regulator